MRFAKRSHHQAVAPATLRARRPVCPSRRVRRSLSAVRGTPLGARPSGARARASRGTSSARATFRSGQGVRLRRLPLRRGRRRGRGLGGPRRPGPSGLALSSLSSRSRTSRSARAALLSRHAHAIARSARRLSTAPSGRRSARRAASKASRSAVRSPATMGTAERIPCLVAFREEAALPPSVRGPVESDEFRRLAATLATLIACASFRLPWDLHSSRSCAVHCT